MPLYKYKCANDHNFLSYRLPKQPPIAIDLLCTECGVLLEYQGEDLTEVSETRKKEIHNMVKECMKL